MTTTMQDDSVEQLYRATTTPRLMRVPPLTFLCLDGHGDPNTNPTYADAVRALFSMSFAAKFAIKRASGQNVKVSSLEGLWWAHDMDTFLTGHKSDWDWTMMIRQPDLVTGDLVDRLAAELTAKKSLPAIHDLRLVTIAEGAAAQVLHVGPYADEGPTIERLHTYIRDRGFVFDGRHQKHHEIYLGDPRRAVPEKLRTIIRQPCSPAESAESDPTKERRNSVQRSSLPLCGSRDLAE
jgi:hypothetical protein